MFYFYFEPETVTALRLVMYGVGRNWRRGRL